MKGVESKIFLEIHFSRLKSTVENPHKNEFKMLSKSMKIYS